MPKDVSNSPTAEILSLSQPAVSGYISKKRRNLELGEIIGQLNYELMFGAADKRRNAGAALEKLGFVLD